MVIRFLIEMRVKMASPREESSGKVIFDVTKDIRARSKVKKYLLNACLMWREGI